METLVGIAVRYAKRRALTTVILRDSYTTLRHGHQYLVSGKPGLVTAWLEGFGPRFRDPLSWGCEPV
jgi:hypothetical protein